MYLLGFDIGGTKCAVITAEWNGEEVTLLQKKKCPTERIAPEAMLARLIDMADSILEKKPDAIGVSCGGPLDAERGIIQSPPNLPLWDDVHVTEILEAYYGVPAKLQNDANACAVAEWKFGAGKGTKNMIFLTFGTGLGAGLILDGRLYGGTNGNAGETGHIRMASTGPVGYGKAGSLEGFCSGGGLSQLGYAMALEALKNGVTPSYFKEGMQQTDVTALSVAQAADAGDETALAVYAKCGSYLGKGLAILIDLFNPEAIVIGSIFARSGHLLRESMQKEIDNEALPASAKVCRVLPAALGEQIGDYAAVATAIL